MKYQKTKLINGSSLTVIQIPSYAVTISAYVKAGFRSDPIKHPGLSHFVEHMLFAGTTRYTTHQKLSYSIEKYGGWHTAFTWIDYQSHEIHLPFGRFEQGVEILHETLSRSLMKDDEIEKEKGRVKEEILRNISDPERALWSYAWLPLFFQETPLSRPYSGTVDDINYIKRDDIVQFYKVRFIPQNTTFLIAGNTSPDEARKLMDNYGHMYKTERKAESVKKIAVKSKTRVLVLEQDTEHVSLAIGVPTVSIKDENRHAIEIIRNMLSRDFGASLPEKLRSQGGLIYTWSSYQDNLIDTGYLLFKTSTSKKNLQKVLSIIIDEFRRIARGEIEDDEIEVAKSHKIGSLQMNIETGLDYINWYGLQELLNPENVLHISDQVKIYESLTKQDIVYVAKKYFDKNKILIAAVGKVKEDDLEKFLI